MKLAESNQPLAEEKMVRKLYFGDLNN